MKQNVLLVVLVVMVAASTVVIVRQRSEIAELKQAARVMPAKSTLPAERPAPAPAKEEPGTPAETALAAPAPALAAASNTNAASNPMSGLAGMMKNPQMKQMVRVQQKVMLDRSYGALYKYLGTRTPAELDTLKQLLEDRQMALVDSGIAMMSGTADDREKAIEDSKAIKADYDKKIADLLGPQDTEVFKQYEATTGERMQVQMFKDALPADAALTEQQEGDLILMMADERKAMPANSTFNSAQNSDPSQLTGERIAEMAKQSEELQKRIAARAASILTPAQLEQFNKWQQSWATMQAAGLNMARTMFGNKGTATPTPAPATAQTPPP